MGRKTLNETSDYSRNKEKYLARTRKRSQEKVDPDSGEPSMLRNAITRATFYGRQTVDPDSGEPSTLPNAISRGKYKYQIKKAQMAGKKYKEALESRMSTIKDEELHSDDEQDELFSNPVLNQPSMIHQFTPLPTVDLMTWINNIIAETSSPSGKECVRFTSKNT